MRNYHDSYDFLSGVFLCVHFEPSLLNLKIKFRIVLTIISFTPFYKNQLLINLDNSDIKLIIHTATFCIL